MESRDAAVIQVLRKHPFVSTSGRPAGNNAVDLGADVGHYGEIHFRLNMFAKNGFKHWLERDGKPFKDLAGGCSDDAAYTLSAVLRHCLPRGFCVFKFASKTVVIRGFRKFTGPNAGDEDEASGATAACEKFYFRGSSEATKFTVTTKSNGENGKFTVRRVAGAVLLFAGSKTLTHVWRTGQDVDKLIPATNDYVPAREVALMIQRMWDAWDPAVRDRFADQVAEQSWTLMLEINSERNEHLFPIPSSFIQFVAILDSSGLPLPQHQAFTFFEEFSLPHVRFEVDLPISLFNDRVSKERAATNREGAVIYLEAVDGSPVGLLKVKSTFYVCARRSREILRDCVIDRLLKGVSLEALQSAPGTAAGLRKSQGWIAAEQRLRAGMRALNHVEGCPLHWEEWAETAVGFMKWLRRHFERAESSDAVLSFALRAKHKFGSTYRDYLRESGLPGGDN